MKEIPLRQILSKYKGVSFDYKSNKFRVIITVNGKSKHIGLYSDEITAAKARDNAVKMLLGDNLRFNFYNDNLNDNDNDYKLVRLTQGLFAKVDSDDYDRVNKFTWCAREKSNRKRKFYAETGCNENGKHQMLHTFIMGSAPDGYVWDHWNGDSLDDRRSNLRLATNQQNASNKPMLSNKIVPFKGVDYMRLLGKFRARIKFNLKEINLGTYDTAIEAALVYNQAAIKYHGSFAKLNAVDM